MFLKDQMFILLLSELRVNFVGKCFSLLLWFQLLSAMRFRIIGHPIIKNQNEILFSGSRATTAWKSARAALRIWPSLWIKGSTLMARAQNDSRLSRLEELYGPLPTPKKMDLEEIERDTEPRYTGQPQRPLPGTPSSFPRSRFIAVSEYGSSEFNFIFVVNLPIVNR